MWLELPQEWLEGLDIPRQVANPKYDNSVNKYACPKGYAGPHNLDIWEKSGKATQSFENFSYIKRSLCHTVVRPVALTSENSIME